MKIIASRKRNILRPEEEHGTFRRTAQDQMNNGTRQRLAVTPNRKKESDSRTMVETIRNEAINQVAVGGNVRATKPAASNPAPWKQHRDTKRRNRLSSFSQDPVIKRTFASMVGAELGFPTAGGNWYRATIYTFGDSDLVHRFDRRRGRGGSVEICCVFALMLNINKCLLKADRW